VIVTPMVGVMLITADAALVGSACGVTVTVTLSGVGAAVGAVYVAVLVVTFPELDACAIEDSVPQLDALQPAPLSVQFSTSLGLEPGTGVSVATMAALPFACTIAGATIVNEKWLVIVIAAEACFDGSATLCAVTVTAVAVGKLCGAE
jgi:hypothetical protein